MKKEEIIEKIVNILILEILLPYKKNEFDSSKSLINDYGLDSIQIMELIVALEDEFKISFDEEGIDIEYFYSIDSLAKLIEKFIK